MQKLRRICNQLSKLEISGDDNNWNVCNNRNSLSWVYLWSIYVISWSFRLCLLNALNKVSQASRLTSSWLPLTSLTSFLHSNVPTQTVWRTAATATRTKYLFAPMAIPSESRYIACIVLSGWSGCLLSEEILHLYVLIVVCNSCQRRKDWKCFCEFIIMSSKMMKHYLFYGTHLWWIIFIRYKLQTHFISQKISLFHEN